MGLTFIKIVQRTQAKKLAAYARKMVDYIVFTCPLPSTNLVQFNQVCHNYMLHSVLKLACDCQVVMYLNELIWKYHIFPLDRLLLCMVRTCGDCCSCALLC